MFLMENVPGLLSASLSGSRTFDLIKSDLSSAGYNLFPLNAASEETHQADDPRLFIVRAEDYGVPQARARVFILGLRSDLGLKPLTLDAAATATNSVWDAICDLPRIRSKLTKATDSGEEWLETIRRVGSYDLSGVGLEFEMKLLLRLSKMQSRLPLGSKAMAPTGKPHAILRDWLRDEKLDIVLNHNSRGHMPRDLMRYFFWSQYAAHFGRSPKLSDVPHYLRPAHGNVQGDAVDVPFADRFRVQLRGRPSTTITSHIAKDGHYYIHPDPSQCRSLSVREAARLQTFPDNYFFEGAATDQYKQVGNAVPPYLAYQIGQLVARVLGK
jgi:DNA (cytosine-5)-methyltransferase 1